MKNNAKLKTLLKRLGSLGCALTLSLSLAQLPAITARADGIEQIEAAKASAAVFPTESSVVYKFSNPVYSAMQPKDSVGYGNSNNGYGELKVPTQIIRTGSYYFLVDCYHDQVLYSTSPGTRLREWKVMTNKASQPHTVASDGVVYLVDDTENHRVMVFEWVGGRFQNTQNIAGTGQRPHYVTYDAPTNSFYVWSSVTGDMYILKREADTNRVYISEIRHINELQGVYVRSFTISGQDIIFPSGGNSHILIVDKESFQVKGRIQVPASIAGMVQIMPIGSWYYITISTDQNWNQGAATIIRTPDLGSLTYGDYEDIYGLFPMKGTPYYINYIDGSYYMCSHGTSRGVFRFNVTQDNVVTNVTAMH